MCGTAYLGMGGYHPTARSLYRMQPQSVEGASEENNDEESSAISGDQAAKA